MKLTLEHKVIIELSAAEAIKLSKIVGERDDDEFALELRRRLLAFHFGTDGK